MLFSHVSSVETAERRADKTGIGLLLDDADRIGWMRRQVGASVPGAQAPLFQVAAEHLRLVGLRRRVKPVQIDDQAISRGCRRSRRWTSPARGRRGAPRS